MNQKISIHGKYDVISRIFAALGLALVLGSSIGLPENLPTKYHPKADFDGTLSVLTYNVRGLPWPLAYDRPKALKKIVAKLRQQRANQSHPEVVLLQEAFIDEARSIGIAAGYRFVADGPSVEDQSNEIASGEDKKFAEAGTWIKGEKTGKLTSSGLQILSDFPIQAVYQTPFPDYACAGYDCLSNKGVMLVEINVPTLSTPVQIANIHMNSKRNSKVSVERRLYAYQRQVDATYAFIKAHRDPRYPIIFGGDFNIGYMAERGQKLFARNWFVKPQHDALRALAARSDLASDAQRAMMKAADWQFSQSGTNAAVTIDSVVVPFGENTEGNMLSDHIGYTINYRIKHRGRSDRYSPN